MMIHKSTCPADIAIGTIHKTNNCGEIEVINYHDAHNVIVRFIDTGTVSRVAACQIRKGGIHDNAHRTANGVGYIGFGPYNSINAKKASEAWRAMINRCYNEEYQSIKARTYADCELGDEWHNFQNFAEWHKNNYKPNERLELDKDLLFFGNRIYSPDKCIFIPQWLNVFTVSAKNIRGEFPVGVSKRKGKDDFEAYCNHDGKRIHLGIYSDPDSAHMAWERKKLEIAAEKKTLMDCIDKRIYPNVIKIITSANNKEQK